MPPLEVFTIAGPGGLQQSQADPDPTGYLEVKNTVIYRGRLAARSPVYESTTIPDSAAGAADAIVGAAMHLNYLYVAAYDDTLNNVNLVQCDIDGTNPVHKAVIWTTVTAKPTAVIMQSFTAGTATSSEDRLYIADFDQNFATSYWTGSALTVLTNSLDLAGPDNTVFSYVKDYQFHVWGTGYYEGIILRPEMLRFSTPGSLPLADIADGTDRAWHVSDWIPIGRRGNSIIGLEVVNQRLLVFQQDALHAINGYNRTSWSVRNLSPYIGAVGPLAFDHYAGKICFFWSATGPMMTDGETVTDIGEPIREIINNVPSDTNIICRVDPTAMLAYFFVPTGAATSPNYYYAFDIQNKLWTEGQFLDDAGVAINIGSGTRVVELGSAAVGPTAAPSSLVAVVDPVNYDTTIDLTWVAGDTAFNTYTAVHRDTTTGFTPASGNEIGVANPGVTEWEDDTCDSDDQYFYKVRHLRNGQYSAASNQDDATTALARPDLVKLSGLVNGIKVTIDNLVANAELNIDRSSEPVATWSDITTLNNQPASEVSHDDTTATCATQYNYRVRTEEAGSTSSPWVQAGPLNACEGVPNITGATYTIIPDPVKDWIRSVKVSWTWNNKSRDDRVWVYSRSPAGGGSYVKLAEVSLNYYLDSLYVCPGPDDIDYKLETWEDNTTLVDTDYVLAVDPCLAS